MVFSLCLDLSLHISLLFSFLSSSELSLPESVQSEHLCIYLLVIMGYKRYKSGRAKDSLLLRLPTHLISDILSRLPIESIFSCRCVCKALEKMLTDPYFAELHLTTTSRTDKRLIIQNNLNPSYLFLFHMFELENFPSPSPQNSDHHGRDPRPWKTLVIPSVISPKPVLAFLVGSCNGLLCIGYATKEHRAMFGFCSKKKQYKVIRFTSRSHSFCELHTLGTNNWRMIENVPHPMYMNSISLNGNLHWLADADKSSSLISSFNLEAERVSYILPPAHFHQSDIKRRFHGLQVGAIGGLLCVSYLLDGNQFDVFVMNDYGVKDSWTKKITIDMKFSWMSQARSMEASWMKFMKNEKLFSVEFLDNEDLLLRYADFPLIYFSPLKGTGWDIMDLARKGRAVDRLYGTYDGSYYVPSFISLKEIAKRENVEVVTLEKLRNIWSYDTVQISRRG